MGHALLWLTILHAIHGDHEESVKHAKAAREILRLLYESHHAVLVCLTSVESAQGQELPGLGRRLHRVFAEEMST